MDIVMVPGFWLQGDSWREVAAPLRDAGHTVHTPTLSGLRSPDDDRSEVTLQSQVAEVVALVDELTGPDGASEVVLVGHSGGGSIIHAVVDARPDAVAHAVYVDTWPTADGIAINEELPAEGDDVPLPDWDAFGEADLRGMTDELRERFRAEAIPQPLRVARDPQRLSDPARFDVPITVVATTFTEDELTGYVQAEHPLFAEFPSITSVTVAELPTGHWPQFTEPAALSRIILTAVST